MGREIRMVPKWWAHPKDAHGNYIPLLRGPFSGCLREWEEEFAAWNRGEILDYSQWPEKRAFRPKDAPALECSSFEEWHGSKPIQGEYMPEWPPADATMLVMYEDTSEGTPISPAFETPEELARWLANNNASACGGMTATYEQWLATCKSGWAVSMVIDNGRAKSGVEFQGDSE